LFGNGICGPGVGQYLSGSTTLAVGQQLVVNYNLSNLPSATATWPPDTITLTAATWTNNSTVSVTLNYVIW
ncbi:MAG TPA: hypothetical protein VM554_16230, partial [Acidisarcina sp.]|nr:hypothetical protein [Acidisarcina sp.]HVJ09927.1 hypothetical protein [Acidisarcina sp.]